LVTGIIGWGGALTYHIAIGYLMSFVIVMVGTILFVIGIALPAKAILGKKDAGEWQGLKKNDYPNQGLSSMRFLWACFKKRIGQLKLILQIRRI